MAFFGDSAALPPEVNYYQLLAGDQGATLEAAALAHQALSDAMIAEIAAMGLNTATTAVLGWQGAGGTAMTMTAAELLTVFNLAVAWLQEAFGGLQEAVAAYHAARDMMIPGPACDSNRVEQAGLVATNVIGQNTPGIVFLDGQYFGEFWPQNASLMASYQAVVAQVLPMLAVPPPLSPQMSNPAAAATGAAQVAAQPGLNALQNSSESLSQAASTPAQQATGATNMAPAQALPAMMSQVGQLSQVANPQQVSQLPQMLSSSMGQFGGLLGPLSGASMMPPGGATPGISAVSSPATAFSAVGAGGGGVGGFGGAPGAVNGSYTKPVSSFNAPSQPRLPGGWKLPDESVMTASSRTASGMGGGGLYGAPASMMGGREGTGQQSGAPSRTTQLVDRRADRGASYQS
ncbi:PPE domain-containing protein [Mycolicibacterium mageritense]|uniref:PPE domain-containing protein n=1 Tax=Mycolicibacterium mageritense TaxID=53462 RepID=UPI001E441EFA|nr:PPE domain-containing protein [Mycolicibacterium mageritense]MCC9184354.1 PPE family protein [Mycolicibacterium mageritense]